MLKPKDSENCFNRTFKKSNHTMEKTANGPMSVTAFAMVIFLLTIKTLNAQKFWLTTYSFPGGPKTSIILAKDNCLFVGTLNNVLRSCDSGYSWDTTLNAPSIFSLFSAESGLILAGGSGRIYYTGNLGLSWDSVSLNHNYPVTKFIQTVNGDIFAITGTLDRDLGFVGAGVFYSDNNGSKWVQRNNGLGTYLSCEHIAQDSRGRLYLSVADEYVTGNAGLFFSDNQGQQWQHIAIEIDGKNAVDDKIKVGNTLGLSVSPADSVYASISGTSVNVGVTLNLHKSTYDITNNVKWAVNTVSNTSIWWNDRLLNNIHFASNGDWYSSMKGSLKTGGTFFSVNKGQTWTQQLQGLGFDQFGSFSNQYYAENNSGKIFMVQLMDELVYWADTSVVTSINKEIKFEDNPALLFPNPVNSNNIVWIKVSDGNQFKTITITNILGKVVLKQNFPGSSYFYAPETKGIYLVTFWLVNGETYTQRLLIN